jgi:hypothetical protein
MSEQDKKTAQYPVGDRLFPLSHCAIVPQIDLDAIALCPMQLQQYDRLLQLAQPRSPFSTHPLRNRPSDRLRCDRPMPNATPAVRSPSPTGPTAIAFLHSTTARSSLRSTQMRSLYARCNSYEAYYWRMNRVNDVKFADVVRLYDQIS